MDAVTRDQYIFFPSSPQVQSSKLWTVFSSISVYLLYTDWAGCVKHLLALNTSFIHCTTSRGFSDQLKNRFYPSLFGIPLFSLAARRARALFSVFGYLLRFIWALGIFICTFYPTPPPPQQPSPSLPPLPAVLVCNLHWIRQSQERETRENKRKEIEPVTTDLCLLLLGEDPLSVRSFWASASAIHLFNSLEKFRPPSGWFTDTRRHIPADALAAIGEESSSLLEKKIYI